MSYDHKEFVQRDTDRILKESGFKKVANRTYRKMVDIEMFISKVKRKFRDRYRKIPFILIGRNKIQKYVEREVFESIDDAVHETKRAFVVVHRLDK